MARTGRFPWGVAIVAVLLSAAGWVPPWPGNASGARPVPALAGPPPGRHGWINETSITREPSPALESATAALYDPSFGAAVAFGGRNASGNVTASTWIFDDGNWEDITALLNGSSPPPLYGASVAFDGSDGYLMLFGGRTATGVLYGGTWSFSSYQWTNRTGSVAPPPESGGAMAFDPASGSVVLEDPASNLTWFYRDGQWSSRSLSPAPSARTGAAMVTDSTTGTILLYGGREVVGGAPLQDTWEYSDGNWTALPGAGGPPAFTNVTATDDPLLDGVFLFGSGTSGSESWLFSNESWSEFAPGSPNPPPRAGGTLLYDPTGAAILCGGTALSGDLYLDDCWSWGVAFLPTSAPAAPPVELELTAAAALLIAAPVAVAIFRSRRPRRPSPTRVPVTASDGRPSA